MNKTKIIEDFEKAFRLEHGIFDKNGKMIGSKIDKWDKKKQEFYRESFYRGIKNQMNSQFI